MSLKLQVEKLIAAAAGGAVDLKLQLGCGHNVLPGWVNTDSAPSVGVDYLDFSRRFPFADGMFVAVFCEHTIEHISKAEGFFMLTEVFRVLRPGGVFRVVTPCLETFCRMVLDPDSAAARKYLDFFRRYTNDSRATISDALNLAFYGHGHRHLYTADELSAVLQQAGFGQLELMRAETYRHPIFNGVDGHGRVVSQEINALEAMAFEATK